MTADHGRVKAGEVKKPEPCDCCACCMERAEIAHLMELEMAREHGVLPPARPNCPFTIRLQ